MKKLLLFFILFLSLTAYSQQEANFWYFGNNAALDFNSGAPVPVTGSALSTTEGCSSFSDSNGDLLFYVGAPNPGAQNLTIWNRNNQPMPFSDVTSGGQTLQGDASSSQSALTVPAPGQPNIYYLFTVGAPSSSNQGFWYYTIDMTADGGNGDIIAGPVALHQTFQNSWTEKVTAVRGEECNEFWVISFLRNGTNGTFYAYKIDETTGVASTPVTSPINNYVINDGRGYLKVSPDGTKLVSANMSDGTFLFNFDDATGVVSNYNGAANPQQVNISENGYGVEFSVSSRRLYVSTGEFNGANENLFQFDLTQPTFTDINNSRNLIHTYFNTRGAIQLGPDNRIYWTSDGQQNISVINNPEELGAAVNYSHQSVNLGGATASQGLPPFLSSLLLPIELTDGNTNQVINNQTLQYCLMDNVLIEPEPVTAQTGTTITYEWTFNDGTNTNVVSSTTNLTLNNLTTANAGDYTLTVTLTDQCGNPTKLEGIFTLEVYNNLAPTAPSDINFCDVDGDGLQAFDFQTDLTPTILNGHDPSLIEVLYYPTETDARDNIAPNQLANPFTPTAFYDGPIWVRVHNQIAPNACNEIYSFNLQITGLPIAQTPDPIIVCDGDGTDSVDDDGLYDNFILNTRDAQILGSLPATQYNVSYHTSLADAQTSATTNAIDKDNNYQSGNDIIYVRVENVDNVNCNDTAQSFNLTINPLPTPVDVTLLQCDDDADLISNVNLTLEQPNISTNYATETFEYYTDLTDANTGSGPSLISDPTAYSATNGDIVYVRTISAENCAEVSEITIVVSFAADVPYNRTFIQCDDFLDFDGNDTTGANDDTDGLATFDFSDARTDILAFFPLPVRNDLDVKFFETVADRASEVNEIPDISNHRNNNDPAYANQQTIYAKIVNTINNDCTGLAELILDVTPVPTANPINATNTYEECDDFMDGDGANGVIQSWNLESLTPTILGGQSATSYTVTYHEFPLDTDPLVNPNLPLASPYTNTSPNTQTIYVRVAGNGCSYDRYTFDLIVNSLPIANPLNMTNTHEVCDNDSDGSATNGFVQNIDLDALTPTILGAQDPANYTVTYHTAPSRDNATLITGLYTNATANGNVVYVRIEENTGCINDRHEIIIQVNPEPLGNPDNTLLTLSECDTDADGDDANGFVTFDLNSQIPDILGDPAMQDEDDFNVTFHLTQTDATLGDNPQSSPFTNTIINGQTIFVRIENKTTSCVNDDVNFEVIVNPLPDFVVTTPQPICLNNPPLTLVAENPNDVYTYQWFDSNGSNIGNDISLDVTVGGEYTVTATTTNSNNMNCSRSRTITVTESNIAVNFEIGDVTIDDAIYIDGSNTNSITINNSNLGQGDYEFALLNEAGITIRNYQDEPVFEGLEGGIYTINVRDKNRCGVVSLPVAVIEFPKFFTPNGDGFNDTWTIKGGSTSFFPTNLVQVFNRQGKVITQFSFNTPGWNGLYKENQMPSDDYWFKIILTDREGNKFTKKGHFSLLRK